jgi:phosphonate transport system substrate-binding protein
MDDRSTSAKPFLPRKLLVGLLGAVILVAALTALLASRLASDRVEIDLAEMAPVNPPTAEDGDALRVAVATILTPTSNFGAYQSLIAFLGSQLGLTTELVQRSSYAGINALLASGGVDLAFVCSGAYIDLRNDRSAELLVVPVVDGSTTYESWVIARSGVDAGLYEHLRGSSFAFVDPLSNTGYYFPIWWAIQLGEDPEAFFGATTFTHSHEKSIEMVAEGVVDAAAVDHLVFKALVNQRPEIGNRVRIIERSPPFGIPPVVVRRGIAPELREKLRDLFLGMHRHDTGRRAMESLGFQRFVQGQEADYDAIAAMRADIERGPW